MMNCVISCGGTGGHLVPGIALAERLIEKGHKCTLVISNKEVDSRILDNYPDLEYVRLPGRGFSLSPMQFFGFMFSLFRGVLFAFRFLKKTDPDVIFGFGGFITPGIALPGYVLKIPIVLHEANRRTGRAIRALSCIADRIYLPPGVELRSLMPRSIRHFGYPVRKSIKKLPADTARDALGIDADGKLLVVMGGSQGASVLNQWVSDHFESLALDGINVYCVTGLNKGDETVIESKSITGEVVKAYFVPFCDKIAELLSAADLVVARAGAGSIAEFIKCQLPCILVPFPDAADDHQKENARYLERKGGCVMLEQKDVGKLETEIKELIFNDWLMDKMTSNLINYDVEENLDLILNDVEEIASDYKKKLHEETMIT